ncbi:MAG: hypothetical protein JRG96_17495 [Deltaproteobacteria bacterium]|nr:hypothetical protein [Deltaproteobacteria bacterium]MBW2418897.1 hypothetical protein [Deltaproteobacteria bacterium]
MPVVPTTGARADGHAVKIAAGLPGGSYYEIYAANLKRLLPDHAVSIESTAGSRENLELLVEGKADLGFAQTDVYADLLLGNPDRYAGLKSLGTLAEECVYLAVRKDGRITELVQLGEADDGRAARIALGPPTSGMPGTWEYMTHLMTSLAAAEVVDDGGIAAVDRLAAGGVDAVGWVTDPDNRHHVMLQAVLNDDALRFLDLQDSRLTGTLPSGIKVYGRKKVKLEGGLFGARAATLCTSGRLLARPGASPELVEAISLILKDQLDTLTESAAEPR